MRHASQTDTLSYTPEVEPTSTPGDRITESAGNVNLPLKNLGANTPSPDEMVQSKLCTNTCDKWLDEAAKKSDKMDNSWYVRSKLVSIGGSRLLYR